MNTAPISSTVIYLVGPPGVGKLTIGRLLADALDARLIDNHLWLNPVFALVEQDGVTPLPARMWPLTEQVRNAVFETAATLTPASSNLVFTHAAVGESERDRRIAEAVLDVARARRARLAVVQLACSPDALAARVVSPERRRLFKETDGEAARRNARCLPFEVGHRSGFRLDTTTLRPEEAAGEILRWIRQAPEIAIPD